MGSGRIKGITIEIGGSVTKLDTALKGIDGQLATTQAKLKDVNYLLKFNPANVTLLTQKQSALTQAISQSKERTAQLKQALAQMKASGAPKDQIEALEREIIQAESKTKALENELKALGNPKLTALSTQFKELGSKIGEVGGKISSAGQKFMPLTMAVGGAATATGALVMKAASAGDRIDKMSQKVGLSRKSFQEMEFAMSQSGGKIESLQTGMKTFTKQMSGAATGTKTSADAFKKLGVSVTDSNGNLKSQEKVMFETIKALQGMNNQTEKAKLANQLFGRSGVELMPLLNQEAGSLDKMRKKANDLGLVMGDDAVDASVTFTDTLDQLKRALATAGAKIGAALLPHIQKFANYIIENMPAIQATIQKVVEKITSVNPAVMKVVAVIALVAAALGPVLSIVGTLVTTVGGLVTAIGFLLSPMGLVVAAIAAVVAAGVLLWKNWDKVKKAAATLWKNLQTSFNQIKTAISAAWNAVKTATSNAWNGIKTAVSGAISRVRSVVSSGVNAVKSVVSSVWNGIRSVTSTAWNAVKTGIQGAISKAKSVVTTAVNTIKSLMSFSGLSGKVSSAFSNVYNTVKSKVSSIISHIKDAFNNFKLKIPKPSLPKITLKTSSKTFFGKTFTYPTGFGISWNKKAMNLGQILNGATIFGMDQKGRLLGGGEAGQEVVVGKNSLMTMVRQASASGSASVEARLANIERLLGRYLQTETKIVLDTGVVAGAVNRNLGVRW